jgi:regulation of enolase protein 1 (concanavalin A-like superfamily)
VTLTWDTDETADSGVAYGLDSSYGSNAGDATLVTSHSVTLNSLSPNTLYHYQISSSDGSGNTASSGDLSFTTASSGGSPSGLVSDSFDGGILNTSLWTFVDPLGDSAVSMVGTQVAIAVPAGSEHDIWSTGNFAPRIRQAANNTDFEVEVKFDSALTQAYQLQGVAAEQDDGNLLRFDFYSNGVSTKIYSASFVNGLPTRRIRTTIVDGVPLYLRVTRQGDQWTESYSYDGANWLIAGSYSHTLTVTSVAVYGGNAGSPAPAHTALIDYFVVDGNPN